MSTASESPSTSRRKITYEAWKQLVMDADAEGVELWTEELSRGQRTAIQTPGRPGWEWPGPTADKRGPAAGKCHCSPPEIQTHHAR